MRQIVEENLIISDELFEFYFNTAMTSGLISIENENGAAILDRGILTINKLPHPEMDIESIFKIIYGLIKKYKAFKYFPRGNGVNERFYEIEPDTGSWNVYNQKT